MILILKGISKTLKLNEYKSAAKVTLSAFILLTVFLTNSTEAHLQKVSPKVQTLKIDTANFRIFVDTEPKINIVAGESLVDQKVRLEREKAEADARAKAEVLAKSQRRVVARERRVYTAAEVDLITLYKSAAARYNLPDWRLLKAVHYVETGGSVGGSKTSYAGAEGPMQFMPSTWRHYGVDGDGDGTADINNVYDAVYSAARYLSTSSGAGEGQFDTVRALLAYNHSMSYVRKVLSVTSSIPL